MFKVKVSRHTKESAAQIAARIAGPMRVKVGLPAGEADGGVIEYATFNEFGTKNIPERPAIRNAVRANQKGLRSVMGKAAAQVLRGESSMQSVLSRMGVYFQGKIQDEITSLSSPPNAPSTIRQKGSSNPLIDSGRYRQSITWKVDG